ncbi:hypothetical protein HZB96_03530 [Candidatus Gottesmanbacteria bacterium]|nr:hypothetical protein [Candidatus Gottesmanbacteria bacterium]MBI5452145.1 hypothetical protein [Candidatus Gottesmanbacteria bacterium]
MLYLFGAIALFIILDSIRGYLSTKNKKKYLFQLFIGVPLVVACLFLFGPLFAISPIKIGYSTLKDNNITLYYPGNSIDMAKDTMNQLKQADNMNRQFYKTTYSMPVVLAKSEFDMLRFGSYPFGGGTGNELTINIRVGRMTTGKIAHEMSHRNLAMLTNKLIPAPNWFNEGLASYIGKMDEYRKPNELQVDLKEGRYIKDILNMRGILGTAMWIKKINIDKAGGVLYGQTYLMTKYLFDKYGQEKMYDFVASLKNNDFNKAFFSSFGMTEEQFHQEFINYIQNYQNNQSPAEQS